MFTIKGILATVKKVLRRGEESNLLPTGVTLRPVMLNETLVFYCTTCGLQHHRPSRSSGTMIEVRRADGHLYAFPDTVADTNCSRCHQLTPFPLLCTNDKAARQLARTIDPTADYEFVRIEPRKE